MKSKHPSIRVPGQSSIRSTFLFRSSNRCVDGKEDVQFKGSNKGSRVSLSDFLDRKLHKSAVLPKLGQGKGRPFLSSVGGGDVSESIQSSDLPESAQGKERPFLSPVGDVDLSGSIKGSVFPKSVQGKERPFLSPVGGEGLTGLIKGEFGEKRRREKEVNCVFDVNLERLRHTGEGKEDYIRSSVGEAGSSATNYIGNSGKMRIPFQGGGQKESTRKPLVVLGDSPKPKLKRKVESLTSSKKPRILYNHYANGSGWWDCNMEGVDSEEVGCTEAWEGIGTTALGGLEWH